MAFLEGSVGVLQKTSLMATENGTNPDPEVQNLPAEPQKSAVDAGAEELQVIDVE